MHAPFRSVVTCGYRRSLAWRNRRLRACPSWTRKLGFSAPVDADRSARTCPHRTYSSSRVPPHDAKEAHSKAELVDAARSDPQEIVSDAVLESIQALSPSVRLLSLRLLKPEASRFTFHPGMWVDFYIPAIDKVGGYTMVSLPDELPLLRLAVKVTKHPPAAWIGANAKPGDKFVLRVGGSFHLADVLPSSTTATAQNRPRFAETKNLFPTRIDHLVMVAGGIGLTPLYAMAQHWVAAYRAEGQGSEKPELQPPTQLTFMYSAGSWKEMVFLRELKSLEESVQPPGRFDLRLHVTRDEPTWSGYVAFPDRIGMEHLVDVLDSSAEASLEDREAARKRVLCCICGPPAMTDGLNMLLRGLGLHPQQIRVERWW